MNVKEEYTLPFESEFDWRVTLFNSIKENAISSTLEVLDEYKDIEQNIQWDNELAINDFASKEKIFPKIAITLLAKVDPENANGSLINK